MKYFLNIFGLIITAAIVGGASIGILGSYIVGMRIPFIGIVMSHAALVGAVLAHLLGMPQFTFALASSAACSLLLGLFMSPDVRRESNIHLSILFSLMIGLTFLLIGIARKDISAVFGLMWGSILFIKPGDLVVMSLISLILFLFCILFSRELKVIMFSRSLSFFSGIQVKLIYIIFLLIASGVITANLNIVGGLLLYSLLTCPAAAAYELGRNFRSVLFFSCIFGIISALGGLGISYILDLPTGACITLFSVSIFGIVYFFKKSKSIV